MQISRCVTVLVTEPELGIPWLRLRLELRRGVPREAEAEASYVAGFPVPLPLPPGPPVRLD